MSARLRPHSGFRRLALADLPAIMAIERSGYDYPWSEGIFRDCLTHDYPTVALEVDGEMLGYAVLSAAAGEAHLLNLCVAARAQGRGYGRCLLAEVLKLAGQRGAATLFLEVRPSNEVAVNMYERAGFARIGRRPAYYPAGDGREDALVMSIACRKPLA